jgi:hypothetical protein
LRRSSSCGYRDRLAGGRSDNQERAIRAFEDCLSVWTRQRHLEQWAAARMNLGIAYWERLAGDPSKNREQAIRAFEDSLSVWTAKHHPDDWATVQMNLGVAYRERGAGEIWENQERAIAAFGRPLSLVTREPSRTVGGRSYEPRHPLLAACRRPLVGEP